MTLPIDPAIPRRLRHALPSLQLAFALLMVAAFALSGPPRAAAQTPKPATGPAKTAEQSAPDTAPRGSGETRSFHDPFEAYEAQAWQEALEGFRDRQAKRPDDPAERLNVGSAHYQMGEYEEATRAFQSVAGSASPDAPAAVRQKAFYNLGNAAYRQGRLEEAAQNYRRALELDPDDEDAKLNLEFVQRELERQRQQGRQQSQDQPGQGQKNQESQDSKSEKSGSQDGQSQPQPSPSQQNQQPQQGQQSPQSQDPKSQNGDESPQPSSSPQPGAGQPDQDRDGLPDELERNAENPTDPANPDTDGDGLQDGAEDLNANGRVDPQETDPNRRDTDGDGTPDGQEPPGQIRAIPGQPLEGLTKEQALRYLLALEENRPPHKPEDARTARAGRPAKDW